jgi:hypothetical protein
MTLALVQDADGNNALQVTADNGSVQVFSKEQVDAIQANTQAQTPIVTAAVALNTQALADCETMEAFCDANTIIVPLTTP